MNTDILYLDHNATTPVLPAVVEAMLPVFRDHFGNPSSAHSFGLAARAMVDRAREQTAALAGCSPQEIIFTSGGTESNNLAILGTAAQCEAPGSMLISAVEHPAVTEPCRVLERRGWRVVVVPVDGEGRIEVDAVLALLESDTRLVSVMHANNETGAIQPVVDLARHLRARGVRFHCDAAQSAGRIPIADLGADFVTLASHKLHGPKGVGALVVRDGVRLSPCHVGASHERGLRPGTENVPAIVGFGVACEVLLEDRDQEGARQREVSEAILAGLVESVPGIALNGSREQCLPNTLNVSFPGVSAADLLARTPGIVAATGAACLGGGVSSSLGAMGLSFERALGAVRISIGRSIGREHVGRIVAAFSGAWHAMNQDRPTESGGRGPDALDP